MLRNLIYFWRMNLAVIAGAAITTAVLTGALVVGDSLRESLRQITLDRLGVIDRVLINDRFFDSDLALALETGSAGSVKPSEMVTAILLSGSMQDSNSGRRASGIELVGIDAGFPSLFPDSEAATALSLERHEGQIFPSVIINEPLQRELGVEVGGDVLVTFGRASDIPSVSLLGRREEGDLLDTLRLTVTEILPARGPGRFGLRPQQTHPLNAFVDLDVLQRRLDRQGQVNTLFLPMPLTEGTELNFEEALSKALQLHDLGLTIHSHSDYLTLESRELVIRPEIEAAVDRVATENGASSWPVLTYLANEIESSQGILPYSTISAFELPVPGKLGALRFRGSAPTFPLGRDQIILNSWAADDLDVDPGDGVRLTYFLVGRNDELITDTKKFEVAAVVDLAGLAADSDLTPELPGVSGADDMSAWDPPFPVDLEKIRPEDEEYWDEYGATPKAFVDLNTGQALWASRYGDITSLRLIPEESSTAESLEQVLRRQLPLEVPAAVGGFTWLPVRQQGLEGASGTSDFSGLFAGFSLFLIVAAVLLVVLLFTLLVEQRGKEAGLLLALGYAPRRLRRRLILEGGILAVLGALFGAGLAVGYARLILSALESWWSPVVESSYLELYLSPSSLAAGSLLSVALVLIAISRAVRRLGRVPARQLLAGVISESKVSSRKSRLSRIVLVLSLVLAFVLLIVWFGSTDDASPALFFGIGSSLVAAGIAGFSLWCRFSPRTESRFYRASTLRLAARNSARHPGRSLLSVALVASASFVLVSVTANRKHPYAGSLELDSGIGGLNLVAESEVAVPVRLSTYLDDRNLVLGGVETDTDLYGEIFSLRLLPGEDTSCLNLYQPEKPRILGVPEEFVARGGYRFRSMLQEVPNPWTLLDMEFEDGAIPAIGDYNSVMWILHLGLGKDLMMHDEKGNEMRLRIVALLEGSIFQSELLVSEKRFVDNFPHRAGYGFFLASVPPDGLSQTIDQVENVLAPYGVDAGSSIERLAAFQEVENMYLTTFEALGGLGLILGTLGLGVVLLRNVIERRGELATLRAFGYRRRRLIALVVAENAFLLVVGLGIGALSGLIAVAPHLATGQIQVPWRSLGLVLTTVFLVGLLASIGAVLGSLRIPLLPALKAE